MKAICPNVPTLFISADKEAGKVLCMAQVSKEVISAKGLKANEWCGQVQALINGKGTYTMQIKVPTEFQCIYSISYSIPRRWSVTLN